MNLTISFLCLVLLVLPCFSSITKRYCEAESKTQDDVEDCIDKKADLSKIFELASECVSKVRPKLKTEEEKLEFICEEVDTKDGELYQDCFEPELEKHEHLHKTTEECFKDFHI